MILTVEEAAVMLGVKPDTVTVWDERFGCPTRLEFGGLSGYAHDELVALRNALDTTFSIASAVARTRAAATPARPSPGQLEQEVGEPLWARQHRRMTAGQLDWRDVEPPWRRTA